MSKDLTALEPLRDGLSLIIRLHDREADRGFLDGLRRSDAGDVFAALLDRDGDGDADTDSAAKAFTDALAALPETLDEAVLDQLAAEYADVYLTHSLRIAPTGSVWLTEEKLERQGPMFAVREWYEHYGVTVPNWRSRSDDHIVHELQFVAHLLGLGHESAAIDAARFLDRHVLSWVPEFCARMAERCREPLLVANARLTARYLEELRDVLQALTGEARWQPEVDGKPDAYSLSDLNEDIAYMPGVAESW